MRIVNGRFNLYKGLDYEFIFAVRTTLLDIPGDFVIFIYPEVTPTMVTRRQEVAFFAKSYTDSAGI